MEQFIFPGRVINNSLLCNLCLSLPLIKLGELGKGAGKGGGGGGAVREAGGAFGKKQAAEEEMYFKWVVLLDPTVNFIAHTRSLLLIWLLAKSALSQYLILVCAKLLLHSAVPTLLLNTLFYFYFRRFYLSYLTIWSHLKGYWRSDLPPLSPSQEKRARTAGCSKKTPPRRNRPPQKGNWEIRTGNQSPHGQNLKT